MTYISLAIYAVILTAIFIIDLKRHLILDKIVFPAIAIALALSLFGPGIMSALLGAGIGLWVIGIPKLILFRSIGWGDVKLAVMVGLMIGYPMALFALVFSVVGSVLVFGLRSRQEFLPFAPFLCSSAMVILVWQVFL